MLGGSIPHISTERAYGPNWDGHQLGRLEIRVQLPVGPLYYPDGETDITSRFERAVPGSTPGRGIVGETEGLPDWVTGPGWKPVERKPCGFNSRSFRCW